MKNHNYSKTTNANGQAVFTLPRGDYRFRADLNGTQFWSGATNHCTVPGCAGTVMTVTMPLTVTVVDADGLPRTAPSFPKGHRQKHSFDNSIGR